MPQSNLYPKIKNRPPELLLLSDSREAEQAYELCRFLRYEPWLFPEFRANVGDDLRAFREELFAITATLRHYTESTHKQKILISPVRSVLHLLPDPARLSPQRFDFGDDLDLNALKDQLYHWGYTFVDVVEEPGEVSFRGDILDIFSIDAEKPVRISLFDTEIESIRLFEVETQKSDKEELESASIMPAFMALSEAEHESLIQKTEHSGIDSFVKDMESLGFWFLEELGINLLERMQTQITEAAYAECTEIYDLAQYAVPKEQIDALERIPHESAYKPVTLTQDVATLLTLHKTKKITVIARNEALLKQYGITEFPNIKVIEHDAIVNIMGPDELIISLNRPKSKTKKRKASIILDELKPGDYVVHESYGIGIFEGITQAQILGAVRDFVQVSYQSEDKLLLPVENLETIDRYVADSGTIPVLDKLGKGSFAKLKSKVKEKLFLIAGEIIKLAAEREVAEGYTIDVKHPDITQFQKDAGFTYTPDQDKSVEEIMNDFRSGRVMDRLLSGDVGFGKTEVAMNAILAVVRSGYQCAMVVPTTLLCHQHFVSMRKRFDQYGIRLAKFDRFLSAKQKKGVLEGLKNGTLDAVVGTHGLLSADFDRLAFVVVDEEHKFGVKQKEAIKSLRNNIHLLSMSATPIPRTLNMALSHIKGMSHILTPPTERQGVRTFVKEYNEGLIKEVILRELRRGGQVFYVYNNIATIRMKEIDLKKLLPDLRIAVLHSKIDSKESEETMLKFEEGEYDVMLSTSIVESGIHLPNTNTMLIDNADRFGIADLHQLRGRVGRSSREGFCYFLVEDKETLTDDAKKRLIALESNSFLGSGSVLAYHDLEIRGGGNILGEAQSGNIKHIGYALYLKMLEDSINELSGRVTHEKKEVDLKLSINAFITPEVVTEDRVRLELYRRLSKCEDVQEVYRIEEEMIDRFGKLDEHTKQFLELIIIKILALEKEVKMVTNYGQKITVIYESEKKEFIESPSKDDDDILNTVLGYLRKTS